MKSIHTIHSKSLYWTGLCIMVALETVLAFSSIGFINIPPVSITTLHIPVLLAALFFGKKGGTIVGAVFGLTSMWKASAMIFIPANLAFSPFDSPNLWGTLVMALGARMAFGFCAAVIFSFLHSRLSEWKALLAGTFLASMVHSFLVYAAMQVFFPQFGLTVLNTFKSLTKVNGLITYVFAMAIISLVYYVGFYTIWGNRIRTALYMTDKMRLTKKHFSGLVLLSCFIIAVAVSLELHAISRIKQILTIYHINLDAAVTNMITSIGLQFILGALSVFVILLFILIHFYRYLTHEAQKAQSARSSFFSNISHDMRTPLNGIIGFTDLALETKDTTKRLDYLNKIRISSNLLLDLVNDTLLMSKIENGMLSLAPEPTAMTELLNNTLIPIQAAADEQGVHLETHTQQGPTGYVLIDRVNTQKIFINLLSNAVKFTKPGGKVTFTLELLATPEAGRNCRITIADTGIGISEEFLPHIYEAFAQENGGRLSGQTGTGLGLSIVKRLTGLMGGTIAVNSKKGVGTTFTLYLNFPAVAAPPSVPAASKGETACLAGKRILLCEDNELNMEIARTFLEQEHLEVQCAANGKEGLEQFTASKPGELDLILMDIHMPFLDGYDATQAIRRLNRPDARTIPILAMTADAYEEDIRHCLAAGMNGHISKPISRTELFSKIAEHLVKGGLP